MSSTPNQTTPVLRTPVIIITGAAGALGRTLALAFAGYSKCHLVLQDLPSSSGSLGALANILNNKYPATNSLKPTASICTADIRITPSKLIDFALDTYGYVTTLINNAGFLRDGMFQKLNQQQFDDIIDIHLNVPIKLTKLLWPQFKQQKFGRIINITSHASLGNVGQSNYSSAKSALWGFTKTLAIEGKKDNIIVNAIAPFAASGMTQGVFPEEMLSHFKPEHIAPVIVYLASVQTATSGEILQSAGGWVSKFVEYTPQGAIFDVGENVSVVDQVNQISNIAQDLSDQVQKLRDGSVGVGFYTSNTQELFAHMLSSVVEKKSTIKQPQSHSAPKQQPKSNSTPVSSASPAGAPAQTSSPFIADTIIRALEPHMSEEIVKKANVTIAFEISNPQNEKRLVTIDLKHKNGGIVWNQLTTNLNTTPKGTKPDATLVITDDLFRKLFIQEVEAQALYLTQKIKVKGNLAAAMKFESILKQFQNKVDLKAVLTPSAKL